MYISSIDLNILLWSAQNCKNYLFSDNLKTITPDGNIKTRQITPFFIYFSRSNCNIHFWIWKYSKLLSCGPPFGPFWSVKYLNFWPKATDLDRSPYFPESRHPEVTKNLYYVLPTCQNQILIFFRLQLMGYIGISSFSAFVLFIINWTMTSSYCQTSDDHSTNLI